MCVIGIVIQTIFDFIVDRSEQIKGMSVLF